MAAQMTAADKAVAIFGPGKVDAIQRAFMDTAEKNLDKRIDPSEIGHLMRAQGLVPTEAQIAEYVREVKGQAIDFDRFLALCVRTGRDDSKFEDLVQFFAPFDPKGTGRVPTRVFRNLMQNMGEVFRPDEVDEMLRDCGSAYNGDSINYREFLSLIMQR